MHLPTFSALKRTLVLDDCVMVSSPLRYFVLDAAA